MLRLGPEHAIKHIDDGHELELSVHVEIDRHDLIVELLFHRLYLHYLLRVQPPNHLTQYLKIKNVHLFI